MSKKLIAVAAAAALALTGLVGIAPANASAPTAAIQAVTGGGVTTGTEAAPAVQEVPDTNTLAKSATLRLSNLLTNDVVRVTTTGTIKVLVAQTAGSTDLNVTTLGTQDFSSTRTASGTLDLFLSTTSTSTGTINWSVVRTGLNSSGVLYMKGKSGAAHTITDVAGVPTVLAKDAKATVSFKITDVFGNAVEDFETSTNGLYTFSPAHATSVKGADTDAKGFNTSTKKYERTITGVEAKPFVFAMDLAFTAAPAGFKAESDTVVAVINNVGVATQIADLSAQLAASRPKANSVTKKRWNKLVRAHRALGGTAKLKK